MSSEEEILEQLEQELQELESSSKQGGYGSPSKETKDNMFKFFREILKIEEPWKVGNLKDEEIGKQGLSIRSNLELASYFKAEGWGEVAKFFTTQAKIVAEPTMGRKGFMAQLFVTQIKKEQKINVPKIKKTGLFGGRNQDESQE